MACDNLYEILPFGNMNIKNTIQLGNAIRTKRRELGVTQRDLAMTCGTGARFIVDLEKGKPTCEMGKALQVIQALGISFQMDLEH